MRGHRLRRARFAGYAPSLLSRPFGLQSLVPRGVSWRPPWRCAGSGASSPLACLWLAHPQETADARGASALQPPCGRLAALDGQCWPVASSGALAARASVSSGSPLPALYPVRQPSPFHDCSQVTGMRKVLSRHKAVRVVPAGPTLYLFHDTLRIPVTWLL